KSKPEPKGPTKELIDAVVQMKQLNPTWGCPRIAQQMALAFDILDGKGEPPTRLRRDQSPISNPMAGNATAEAFIRHQWLPDSPETPVPCWRTLAGKQHFQIKPFAIGDCKPATIGSSG